MKIIKETLNSNMNINNFIDCTNQDVIFFDIETTGFHRDYSHLYLLGYVFYENGKWVVEQHLAETPCEEMEILKAFHAMIKDKGLIISYNGDAFDFPYVNHKMNLYDLPSIEEYSSLDLYKEVKKYKTFLGLENYKLKTIEKFVGIYREDPFTGGELIEQYNVYVETKDPILEYNLLLHNKEDMSALLELMSIYNYLNVIKTIDQATYMNHEMNDDHLTIHYSLHKSNAIKHEFNLNNLAVVIEGNLTIHIPLYKGEMYYFFKDYKNYYYLPQKDEVIHKSMAVFISKSMKQKAKASNCYLKREDRFLPLFSEIENVKVFRKSYKDKQFYITLDDFKDQLDFYMHHLLKNLKES